MPASHRAAAKPNRSGVFERCDIVELQRIGPPSGKPACRTRAGIGDVNSLSALSLRGRHTFSGVPYPLRGAL
jgi:hypothetical protein